MSRDTKKRRISAIPAIWHASCNMTGIGGRVRRRRQGEYTMSGFSQFARHALAVVSAVFISGLLMINSLAVSANEVNSVAGILA
jgi:hypothetical protein